VIIVEASLSFWAPAFRRHPGLGLHDRGGRDVVTSAWWVSLFPGLTILFVVLAFNCSGLAARHLRPEAPQL